MTRMQWQEVPARGTQSKEKTGGNTVGKNDLWFGVSLLLMGAIGGYILAVAL